MSAILGAILSTPINVREKEVTDKYYHVGAKLTFGDGALTYPAGGIPVLASTLGFRNTIRDLVIVDAANADGYLYKYDATNKKIRIYQVPAAAALGSAAPLLELTTAATPAATILTVRAEGY